MTNTLHRFGPAESFRDDYVVFAIASKGRNDEGALEKLRRVLRIGGADWKRDVTPDLEAVIAGLDAPTTVAAVFDNRVAAEDFVKAVKEAELGLSVNISTSVDGAEQCWFAAGVR